jgi:hypothetical protein
MFRCKVCDEKEKRIHDLLSQVESLKKLVFPSTNSGRLPVLEIEADAILGGAGNASVEPDEDELAQEQIDLEANAILTGSYS